MINNIEIYKYKYNKSDYISLYIQNGESVNKMDNNCKAIVYTNNLIENCDEIFENCINDYVENYYYVESKHDENNSIICL